MIDFTNCQKNKYKYYGGKNGGKICIIYNNQDYMLKFPSINNGISEHEYSNSCISEYIACHIINSIGLNVQETILGKYKVEEEEKIVVACKDFTSGGNILKQFAELKNSQIETSKNGYGTELAEVIETIENQPICDPEELKKFFWDMFIVDSFVGNFDRHNGNWGFLINETLSDLINTGNNINSVEPLRDFNGYSWTTITREIESINHNLIYQNLVLLVGNVFMENWVNNKEIMIDYMEKFTDKISEQYGKELAEEFIKLLEKISVFMEIKYNTKNQKRYLELKDDIQTKLEKMMDNKTFVENVTKEKKKLTK